MSRSRKNRARLSVERLDCRALPSVTYNPLLHRVEIQGSNGADTYNCFQVVVAGKPLLNVEEGVGAAKMTHSFDLLAQPVGRITAVLNGGNDRLTCDSTLGIPLSADGGVNNDTIYGTALADSILGGDGLDTLFGQGDSDTIIGGNQNDYIDGGDGPDRLEGSNDNDTIFGGGAGDTILGQAGNDQVHGDGGDDQITGDIGNDRLWGDAGFDTIDGGDDSNDTIHGGTEDDTLYGGGGNDQMFGDSGNDTMDGEEDNDSMNGGVGFDTLLGGDGMDTLIGGENSDSLDGGAQNDRLQGEGFQAPEFGNDTLRGGTGNDQLFGDAGNDQLFGDAGNDTEFGGAGEDRIYGNAGNDQLNGEDGNDLLFGDQGTDVLSGGKNDDTIVSIDVDTVDVIIGGGGFDSFWIDKNGKLQDNVTDKTAKEADTNLHLVSSFRNGADKTMDGDGIADPSGGESMHDFDDHPLFSSTGPHVTDVDQGALGDCWLLASLATAVNVTPNVARQLIVDLGDGTYAVQISNDFYRVDTDLPVFANNPLELQFAGFGADESMWVPLVEKAWAIHRNNDYINLENDSPYFPLGKIGGVNRNLYHIAAGDNALGDIFAHGWAGTFASRLNERQVHDTVAKHCYAIISVAVDANGDPASVLLYNPHGVDNTPLWDANDNPILDGNGDQARGSVDGVDDGFVTLTIDQFAHDAQEPIGVITADFTRFKG